MASRFAQEEHFILLRLPHLVSSSPAMGGFSVLKGAARLLASPPFSHRPPHPETDTAGAVPWLYRVGRNLALYQARGAQKD